MSSRQDLYPSIRVAPAGAGYQWLRAGFDAVGRSPGVWIGFTALWLAVAVGLAFVPIAGSIISGLLGPLVIAAACAGARAQGEGRLESLNPIIEGFKTAPLALVGLGLIVFVASMLAIVLPFGIAIGLIAARIATDPSFDSGALLNGDTQALLSLDPAVLLALAIPVLLALMVALLLIAPILAAYWLAPPLVAFHRVSPWRALSLSFMALWRNWRAFTVFGLLLLPATLLALLPLGLGLLVLIPVTYISIFVAWRELFEPPSAMPL